MKFDNVDYEQEDDDEPKLLTPIERARCRTNLFIDAKVGVHEDASGDEESDEPNYDLDGFMVAYDVED